MTDAELTFRIGVRTVDLAAALMRGDDAGVREASDEVIVLLEAREASAHLAQGYLALQLAAAEGVSASRLRTLSETAERPLAAMAPAGLFAAGQRLEALRLALAARIAGQALDEKALARALQDISLLAARAGSGCASGEPSTLAAAPLPLDFVGCAAAVSALALAALASDIFSSQSPSAQSNTCATTSCVTSLVSVSRQFK